jgi:hypothetical protein
LLFDIDPCTNDKIKVNIYNRTYTFDRVDFYREIQNDTTIRYIQNHPFEARLARVVKQYYDHTKSSDRRPPTERNKEFCKEQSKIPPPDAEVLPPKDDPNYKYIYNLGENLGIIVFYRPEIELFIQNDKFLTDNHIN